MDIFHLARRRAEAASRLEALAGLGQSRDPEETRELAIAMSRAEAAYRQAELDYQRATALLTSAELTVMEAGR